MIHTSFFPNFFSFFFYFLLSLQCFMKKTQKALVIQQYGGKVVLRQIPIPQLKKGEVLIKVDASTINPSDKFLMDGACFERPLPSICGIQGTGRVVDANGQIAKLWIGTRVSFISPAYGSWVEYSIATPHEIFQIEQDIPINCAACGLINPLTALGFVERFRTLGCKYGMINTAAASALGRMLIRICKSEKIPLLNIVRKQEHKQKLLKEGADYIIVTKNGWVKQYKAYIYEHKFDCLLDALGGGPITQNLIDSLLPGSRVLVYGALEGKPIVISSAIQLLKGLSIQGFLVFSWWGKCSQEEQEKIRGSLNTYLVNQLSTNSIKSIRMEDINQGLQLSQKRASEGKVILRISQNS